jgi:hypothetical protein
MSRLDRILVSVALAAGGCANASGGDPDGGPVGEDAPSCADTCDADGDGVLDGLDECPATPSGEDVNQVGCSDAQVMPTLEPDFPPFGLTWMSAGDLGRAGGLTWTYTGIDRGDRFHIYWVICDDPSTPCGVSLDGPIDAANERWQFSPLSALGAGRLIFNGMPTIQLADTSTLSLSARLVLTIVDGAAAPVPIGAVAGLGVPARDGMYGAELTDPGFVVTAIIEVQDTGGQWVPYLDYYDAAPTPDPGGGTAVSFGGSFYSE